jgi:isocitrate dehydrogenase (NAD+)
LPEKTLDSIRRNGIALKGPLTTPVGEGFSSINVSLRTLSDLHAIVRPVISVPGTRSRYENVDIISVCENTEGAYLAADAMVSEDGSRHVR